MAGVFQGKQILLEIKKLLGTEWGFSNVQEELLFVMKSQPWYRLKIESAVEIGAQWQDLDELPLLMMLGWYLRVQNFYAGW